MRRNTFTAGKNPKTPLKKKQMNEKPNVLLPSNSAETDSVVVLTHLKA
jgi:hypothetical protein